MPVSPRLTGVKGALRAPRSGRRPLTPVSGELSLISGAFPASLRTFSLEYGSAYLRTPVIRRMERKAGGAYLSTVSERRRPT
jgi:hypothetical protein